MKVIKPAPFDLKKMPSSQVLLRIFQYQILQIPVKLTKRNECSVLKGTNTYIEHKPGVCILFNLAS